MIRASGILIVSTEGKALFLKRSPVGDMAGAWCTPGGKLEDGEDSVTAAVRETLEETGYKVPQAKLVKWTRRISAAQPLAQPPGQSPTSTRLEDQLSDAAQAPATMDAPSEVDFTTYLLKDVEEFVPTLDAEHVAYSWTPLDQPPEPLHPGVRVALDRFQMNELGIAQAIAAGELTSPQWYENIALFAIRITGTGVAFRQEKKDAKGKVVQEAEFVHRDKSHYLTEEFLARCNGLPVILEHPKKSVILNTEEYKERTIGSVFLPFIAGEEVWAVAKIYDQAAASMMENEQVSTSPAVVWRDPDANNTVELENGQKWLIEGKPSLLDHIAVCWQGVWDKGGDPKGVTSATIRGDDDMKTPAEIEADVAAAVLANAKKYEGVIEGLQNVVTGLQTRLDAQDKARADAEEKEKEERKDSAGKRVDAFKFSGRKDGESDEDMKGRRDAEEEKLRCDMEEAGETKEMAADKAKRRRDSADEEDTKEAKAKADAAEAEENEKKGKEVADSVESLRKQLDELKAQMPKAHTDTDLNAIARVQARADEVMTLLGSRARPILPGESLLSYRRHFVTTLKEHSDRWKDKDLTVVAADEGIFTAIEDQVLTDALSKAKSPAAVKAGELRMTSRSDGMGHTINTFDGTPDAWMTPLAGPVRQYARAFNTPDKR
jgi:8-oxo-dGTP pyrophosphatase MutT (NUDIX family)